MRFSIFLLWLFALTTNADDALLPVTPPPFTLGDICVVQTFPTDKYRTFKLTCFGRRYLRLTGGEDFGDGLVIAKQVSSGFTPASRQRQETALSDVRVWNRDGNELTEDQIARLTANPTRAIVLRAPIDDRDTFVTYSSFFSEDVLFVYPGPLLQAVLDARNSGRPKKSNNQGLNGSDGSGGL